MCNVGYCCDYYAICELQGFADGGCYTTRIYYTYDYWWVYTIAGVLLLISIIAAIVVARRRRMRRNNMLQDTIIVNDTAQPSYTMGEPVYNQPGFEYQPNNPGYNQGGYNGYNQGGGYNPNYGNGGTNPVGYNQNANILSGNVAQNISYELADQVSQQPYPQQYP